LLFQFSVFKFQLFVTVNAIYFAGYLLLFNFSEAAFARTVDDSIFYNSGRTQKFQVSVNCGCGHWEPVSRQVLAYIVGIEYFIKITRCPSYLQAFPGDQHPIVSQETCKHL
jgi:hypothetical protein